jgi:hypothetical protein
MNPTRRAIGGLAQLPRRSRERLLVVGRLARVIGERWLPAMTPGSLAPTKRARIVFQSYSVHLAQFYRAVIREIRCQDSDADIWFEMLPHPHFPPQALEDLRDYAVRDLEVDPGKILGSRQMARIPADLVVCGDVFARLRRRSGRHCLLLHGPALASRALTRRPLRRSAFDFDLVLVNGEFDRRRLAEARDQRGARARIEDVGLPYLDGLDESLGARRRYLARLGLDERKPTVMFGPAWNGIARLPDRGHDYVARTVDQLTKLPVNVLLKLHACSLNTRMSGGADWGAWLRELPPGVAFDPDPDDLPALAHCDVLVTDRSSRALNFMALCKPVVVWDPSPPPEHEWDRARLVLIRGGARLASGAEDVARLCASACDEGEVDPGSASTAREAISFFDHAAGPAARVLLREAASAFASRVGDGVRVSDERREIVEV